MILDDIKIDVVLGDITQCKVDAIVNAANNEFKMGGGVAGVIKRKGGSQIEDEAIKSAPAELSSAIITGAGALSAKYVIHAVTMTMNFKTDADIIRAAAYNALLCAHEYQINSIALCALGCGTGGFSYETASKIMAQEVFRYARGRSDKNNGLKEIIFVLNGPDAFKIFQKNVIQYLQHMKKTAFNGPYLTVDGIVLYEGGIVMIERSNPPLGWALPGGFVDYGESLEEAVVREVKEETNLNLINPVQFKAYSKPDRDPRFHTVAVVFVGQGKGILAAASDAANAKVVDPHNITDSIAFDHASIIKDYLASRKK
jgi:8-oxo-dGTP diphosphatase